MDKPLQNKKILVTREEDKAAGLASRIEALGGRAVLFPTIKIQGAGSWEDFDRGLGNIAAYDWIVFTSANAVYYFFQRAEKFSVRDLPGKIAAVGTKTEEALRRHVKNVDLTPAEYSAAGLLEEFEKEDLTNRRVLLPTSNIARDELANGLRNRGAVVDAVVVYETVPNRRLDVTTMKRRITDGGVDCVTFFSPSAFDCFLDLMGADVVDDIKKRSIAVAAIGPTTAAAVKNAGLPVDIQPRKSLEEDLVAALAAYYSPPV